MMKKILFGLTLMAAMASCTEDYKDWASPVNNPQEPTKSVEVSVTSAGSINLANAEESIQLFTPSVVVSDEAVSTYTVELYADAEGARKELTADSEGKVLTVDLQDAVVSLCGARPVERSLFMDITCLTNVAGQSIQNFSKNVAIKITPEAPFIDPAGYYVVGNIDGWTCTRVDDFHMVNNGGDVYENPEFSVTIAAVAGVDPYEVKFVPSSAFKTDGSIENWGIALSALPDVDEIANKGSFSYNNAGGNIKFAAVEGAKFYTIKANLLEGTYEVTSLSFNPFVYFIGATDGWSNAEQKLALTDDSGIYTGYLYCADPNGWGNEFKFQKVPGDWGTEINSGHMTGGISGDFADGGGNFKATAGEGVYYVTLNLNANTLNGIFVNKMGIIGDFNGWGGDVEMTWNATDYCFEATGAGVTANGWKFRINADWGINLGANDSAEPSTVLDDLVANGKNLGVAGNTIKLYPTRKTSDKIYCTVE
jgi:hypothetical protein